MINVEYKTFTFLRQVSIDGGHSFWVNDFTFGLPGDLLSGEQGSRQWVQPSISYNSDAIPSTLPLCTSVFPFHWLPFSCFLKVILDNVLFMITYYCILDVTECFPGSKVILEPRSPPHPFTINCTPTGPHLSRVNTASNIQVISRRQGRRLVLASDEKWKKKVR